MLSARGPSGLGGMPSAAAASSRTAAWGGATPASASVSDSTSSVAWPSPRLPADRQAAAPETTLRPGLTPRGGGGADTLKAAGLGVMQSPKLNAGSATLCPRYDVTPTVQPAGKTWAGVLGSPVLSLPSTPDTLCGASRRHKRRTGPGEITVHWGMKDFKAPRPEGGFGAKSSGGGEGVEQTFRAVMKIGVAEYKDTCGEEIYASTRREPLGKGYLRGEKLPEATSDPDFRFGKPSVLGMPVKECISPRGVEPESEEARALYRKTHMSTEGGEMLTRNYEWPAQVDCPTFRFGNETPKDSNNQGLGVKSALSCDTGAEALTVPATIIGPNGAAFHREVISDKLGRPRSLNQATQRGLPDHHVFGLPTSKDATPHGELVRGSYLAEDQLPDRDLGRCLVKGRRNHLTREPMGVPSVRTDRVPPPREKRSVASFINWGDDASANSLLSPGRFNSLGVEDVDFRRLRTAAELQNIFQGAGHTLPAEALEAAALACGTSDLAGGGAVASVEAVMHMCADWSAARAAAPVVPTW
mmetsp:Transcript_4436/g.15055  ORF Transcript_4436/g.15055 Transcript_4436/m.15055 type:complete len:529 (+) Transcript_4436:1-1587(+)